MKKNAITDDDVNCWYALHCDSLPPSDFSLVRQFRATDKTHNTRSIILYLVRAIDT